MRRFFFIIIIISLNYSTYAQWECRSKIGSHLKPVGESNLMWASEITTSGGFLTNNRIANLMGFVGLDYSVDNHMFYFEGGAKYWDQYDYDLDTKFDNYRFGIREGFYQYRNDKSNLILGLHSAKLNDYYLVNERILGVSYNLKKSKWNLKFASGTVTKAFSRNGFFCSTGYLYNIIPGRTNNNIGNDLGDTNFSGLTLEFLPGVKKEENDFENFSENDFQDFSNEFDSFEEVRKEKLIQLENVGSAIYSEYGKFQDNLLLTGGLYATMEITGGIKIKPELLMQSSKDNSGIISILKVEKVILWDNTHKSIVSISYYDFNIFDKEAIPLNRFSNILAGEVLRLEVPELPVYHIGIKHTIPRIKTHFKFQYAFSNQQKVMEETNFQVGKTWFKKLLINTIYGYIKSDLIPKRGEAYLVRVEMRYSF